LRGLPLRPPLRPTKDPAQQEERCRHQSAPSSDASIRPTAPPPRAPWPAPPARSAGGGATGGCALSPVGGAAQWPWMAWTLILAMAYPARNWGQDQVGDRPADRARIFCGAADQGPGRISCFSPRAARQGEPVFLDDMSLEQFACPVPRGRLRWVAGADDFVAACVGQRRALVPLSSVGTNRFVWRAAIDPWQIPALAGMALVNPVRCTDRLEPGGRGPQPRNRPCAGGLFVPQSRVSPWLRRWLASAPCGIPPCCTGGDELSPRPEPLGPLPRRWPCRSTAQSRCGYQEPEDPWGSVMWKPWLRSNNQPQGGRLPDGSGEVQTSGRSRLVTATSTSATSNSFQAISNNYRFPRSAAMAAFSNPRSTTD